MTKSIVAFTLLTTAISAQASTVFYGEANARLQLQNNSAGSTLLVDGLLSEFGYKGEQALSDHGLASFDILLGIDALSTSGPYLNQGHIGIKDDFGEIAAFYGPSPVAASAHYLSLMNNDPDSINQLFGYNSNDGRTNNSPKGVFSVDGISYRSPVIENNIVLDMALIPAENPAGSTGISFAGRLDNGSLDVSAGFEVNVEQASSQLFRFIGEYQTGNLKVGGHVQLSSNNDTDYSSSSYAGFVKLPIRFSSLETNNRVMLGYNLETDAIDETTHQLYMSGLQEIPWNAQVSSYSFVEILLDNDLASTTVSGGGGLKIGF